MRDILIIIAILIIILGGAVYTKNYLNKTVEELNMNLNELKEEIIIAKDTTDRDTIKNNVKNLEQKWNNIKDKWAIIILHDELDKIETSITKMKSGIEDGNLDTSLEELETSIFLVNHIKEKERFCLKNIL